MLVWWKIVQRRKFTRNTGNKQSSLIYSTYIFSLATLSKAYVWTTQDLLISQHRLMIFSFKPLSFQTNSETQCWKLESSVAIIIISSWLPLMAISEPEAYRQEEMCCFLSARQQRREGAEMLNVGKQTGSKQHSPLTCHCFYILQLSHCVSAIGKFLIGLLKIWQAD